jgi:small subunit ribosomal protein S3
MGQKVHPVGFRLGTTRTWDAKWYADKNYTDLLKEDMALRTLVRKRLANASISRIELERAANQLTVTVHTARPGIVIGKSGQAVEEMRQLLERTTKKRCRLNVIEIRNPEVDAFLVARNVADQLEKRVAYRRAMKQAVQRTMRAGAKGCKILAGGRLGGNEIASRFKETQGSVPLHTLRADIDYGMVPARTTFGVIGIKVWIYKGDVMRDGRRIDTPSPVSVPDQYRDRAPRGGRDRPGARGGFRTPSAPVARPAAPAPAPPTETVAEADLAPPAAKSES